eukprot:1778695-Prymnesium_polylepis.1
MCGVPRRGRRATTPCCSYVSSSLRKCGTAMARLVHLVMTDGRLHFVTLRVRIPFWEGAPSPQRVRGPWPRVRGLR